MFVNGISLGVQQLEEHFFYFNVTNEEKETKLFAKAGVCCDSSIIRKVETFNETYRLKEAEVLLNWFDIIQPKGYFSLNDKMSDIMAHKEAAEYV